MPQSLKIGYAASECVPFAKTGGLGDVAAALPRQLFRDGHDVRPFVPLYGTLDRTAFNLTPVPQAQNVPLPIGWRNLSYSLWTTRLDGSDLDYYLVDCPELFEREQIYGADEEEALRFAGFSSAVLSSFQRLEWSPDIVHANDWHTALLPLLLRTTYEWDQLFAETRSVLTLHNLGYQGWFPARWIDELGLGGWTHLFDAADHGRGVVNFLRTGLMYADALTTVSPTYAREIQTAEQGQGFENILSARSGRLIGILNGVDTDQWHPENDPHIPHRYSSTRLEGKKKNKQHLLAELGLDDASRPPLIGMVSRLTAQKGFDLCLSVLPDILANSDCRLVVLGSGEERYESFFEWLQQRYPTRVVFYRGYSEELAHLIEAGADMFLMPSLYEPCGLNQMFSQIYGTVPVVRRTGGLADSVEPFDPKDGTGTGILFDHATPQGLDWAMRAALDLYAKPKTWKRLIKNGMARDFTWKTSAAAHADLYHWLREQSPQQ
ncbi:MAG: glycogen synthase [Acidobacteriota bacterium]|nr:glycogen synthase [Acidobacteriota bacterium]